MTVDQELEERLRSVGTAPYLFLGSGMAMRYLGIETWLALLDEMSSSTALPFSFFKATADGSNPRIASLIAAELNKTWWTDQKFAHNREQYPEPATAESALKIEVAQHVRATAEAGFESMAPALQAEYKMLVAASGNIDGVITTNYDDLAQRAFPDFTTLVGQSALMFRNFQGVGEIYQIHGSISDPESLILTDRDYDVFEERNPYLAAKLLTIFMEHPVIFLGYSLSDSNVQAILASIVKILTPDTVDQLQDRLIFVNWDVNDISPTIETTVLPLEGTVLPIVRVNTHDFSWVYETLGRVSRKYSAKLLRHLKTQVYELVRTSEPTGRIRVVDFDKDADLSKVDLVIGVGIHDQLAAHGLVGIQVEELFDDLLAGESLYSADAARMIVGKSLKNQFATKVPFYRWLRLAEYLTDDGVLVDGADVLNPIKSRVSAGREYSAPADGVRDIAKAKAKDAGSLEAMIGQYGPRNALRFLWALKDTDLPLEGLRSFLLATRSEFGRDASWKKSACLYDFRAFSRPLPMQ